MSSSPPTSGPVPATTGKRHRLRSVPLRTRLLATTLGLLALICLMLAVTTGFAVHHVLIGRLDSQLFDTAKRRPDINPKDEQGGTPLPTQQLPTGCSATDEGNRMIPPGGGFGTVAAYIQNGRVCRATIQDGTTDLGTSLAASTYPAFLTVPVRYRHAYTVTVPGHGDYRMTATYALDGDIMVTGLQMGDVEDTLNALTVAEISISLGGLLLAGSIGTVLIRRELRPLRRMVATARSVTELPLDRGEVALSVRVPTVDTDPRTEVGQVGNALNRMLGHVASALRVRQASENRMRQFLADASHELRTPLAAIRGYAELSRRMDGQVPPDVAHAMRRVESEAHRMTTLVEDLLLLARLDSGRPLDRDPVDLSQLVVDVVSDAHAAGPGHDWQLGLPDEPVVVVGDRLRLHQVLANLLANARAHTPSGTRVTVRLGSTVDHAWLEVSDNGPGIPEHLLPDIFNRFARGDSSRSRAAGSTGLGLAIVAAVVDSHHGTVQVASQPGRTVFTVTLPLRQPTPPQSAAAPAPAPGNAHRRKHLRLPRPTPTANA